MKNTKKIWKEVVLLFLLISFSSFIFINIFKKEKTLPPQVKEAATSSPFIQTPGPTTTFLPSSTAPSDKPLNQTTSKEVFLEIVEPKGNKNFKVSISNKASALEILQKASTQYGFELKTKDFGGPLGLFIESIDGIKNDNQKQIYWQLYVNDIYSQLGASSVIVSPGDTVTWKYKK